MGRWQLRPLEKSVSSEYAKFILASLDILSGKPPVLQLTLKIFARHLTAKSQANIKLFAGDPARSNSFTGHFTCSLDMSDRFGKFRILWYLLPICQKVLGNSSQGQIWEKVKIEYQINFSLISYLKVILKGSFTWVAQGQLYVLSACKWNPTDYF